MNVMRQVIFVCKSIRILVYSIGRCPTVVHSLTHSMCMHAAARCIYVHIQTGTYIRIHGCCGILYLSAAIANLGVSIHFPGVTQININIAIHCLISMYNNCIKEEIIIHDYVVGALLHTRCFTQSREQNLRSNFEKGTTPARGRPHQLHVPALNKGEDQTALLQKHKQGRTCTSARCMKGTQAHAELGTQQLLHCTSPHPVP